MGGLCLVTNNVSNDSAVPDVDQNSETDSEMSHSPGISFLFLFGCLLVFLTIIGNLMVIIAFVKEPTLQVLTNYWIISLSCTDLILATIVMPIFIVDEINGPKWLFGGLFCDIFIILDVLCCTCSIYHLGLISLDRYFCVKHPLTYPKRRNKKGTLIAIGCCWLICIAISVPRLIGWKDTQEPRSCKLTNTSYKMFSSLMSFYLPLLLIIWTYSNIYVLTRKQGKKFASNHSKQSCSSRFSFDDGPRTSDTSSIIGENIMLQLHNKLLAPPTEETSSIIHNSHSLPVTVLVTADTESSATNLGNVSAEELDLRSVNSLVPSTSSDNRGSSLDLTVDRTLAPKSNLLVRGSDNRPKCRSFIEYSRSPQKIKFREGKLSLTTAFDAPFPLSRGRSPIPSVIGKKFSSVLSKRHNSIRSASRLERNRQKQEQRAAKVVTVILSVFLISWTPFFASNIVDAFCHCISVTLWRSVTWLGYANSAVNPFIYTLFNKTFRHTIQSMFGCRQSRNSHRRRAASRR